MKKVMILLTVLAMNSLASAELFISVNDDTGIDDISINVSDTITISVYNSGGITPINFTAYLDFYYKSEGGYSLSNPRPPGLLAFPPPFTGPYDGGYDNDEFEITMALAAGQPEILGDIFLVDLHCELADIDVYVELWDWRIADLVDTLTIHQVPEPAAIALLGLGALFLRKRKK